MSRELWALACVLLYGLLCAVCVLRFRRRQARAAAEAAALLPSADAGAPTLVLHASQTGSAEALAWQTARTLHLAGRPVRLLALGELTLSNLMAASHALFVASTYGEGDAPDSAVPFARDLMTRADLELAHLSVGVLALGDRSYTHFCGFGRELEGWLLARGARPLFARIELDQGGASDDKTGLSDWQHQLSHLAGTAELPQWEEAAFERWHLVARQHLNPGSLGGGVFHLELAPAAELTMPDWEAGDLVQILAPGDAQPREYTLASLPTDGRLHLMVRQLQHADGSPGLVSGLLTRGLELGGTLALRLRRHTSFRIGANADRPLILIGNGTGLAGLRAHLKARARSHGPAAAWLIYGERQAACDMHYGEEISTWQQSGLLSHVDRVFSRDGTAPRYVQEALAAQRARLLDWVARGAAIYVCGSLAGMAAGVHAVLCEVLGEARIDELMAQGRYRRDVY
jgi:sulfite reductase (NADPH) flavoprotein alpha-component